VCVCAYVTYMPPFVAQSWRSAGHTCILRTELDAIYLFSRLSWCFY
jgi:hypothetical protein